MQKFSGKVTDTSGNPVANARLSVYQANVLSPLPTVYKPNSDNTLGTLSNPFLTGSDGQYAFVVGSGEYEIRATGSSAVLNISKTITDFTPASITPVVPVTLNRQIFTGGSSWTAPAGVTQATITCVAGGAGGQAGNTTNGGVGGGAGATVIRTLPVSPGTTYAIVVGAGGAGGTAPAGSGTDGGDTTFGSLVTAQKGLNTGAGGRGTTTGYGGSNALSVVANTSATLFYGRGGICAGGDGGAGGVVGGTLPGADGVAVESFPAGIGGTPHVPVTQTVGGGGGGASAFGAGGDGGDNATGAATGGAGTAAAANTGGGGGGGASGGTTGGAGGAGGSGLCIVEWIS